jgi:hypothetical protein
LTVEEYGRLSCNALSFGKLNLPLASADFLFGFLFDPEDRSDMFLRNAGLP